MTEYQYAPEVAHLVADGRDGMIPPPPGEGQFFLDFTHFEFGPGPEHPFLFAWCYLRPDEELYIYQKGRWIVMQNISVRQIGIALAHHLEDLPQYGDSGKGLGIMAETIAEAQRRLRRAREAAESMAH